MQWMIISFARSRTRIQAHPPNPPAIACPLKTSYLSVAQQDARISQHSSISFKVAVVLNADVEGE